MLFTFLGVAIAVVVLLLAGLLQKRTAKAAPQTPKASMGEHRRHNFATASRRPANAQVIDQLDAS